MHPFVTALLVFAFIAIILAPLFYQIRKWNAGNYGSWTSFEADAEARPEDLHFSVWTGNLLAGKKELSYPLFASLPDFDSAFIKWLTGKLASRTLAPFQKGSVGRVKGDTQSRKIYTAVIMVCWVAAVIFLVLGGIDGAFFADLSPWRMKSISNILLLIVLISNAWSPRMLDVWSVSPNKLMVGRWIFTIAIPWIELEAVSIGFQHEKILKKRRQIGFVMEIKYRGKNLVMRDASLGKLLNLYDAIVARRPDLKIS